MCVKCGHEVQCDGSRDLATGISNMEVTDRLDKSHCGVKREGDNDKVEKIYLDSSSHMF